MPTLKYRTLNPQGGFLSGPFQEAYWEPDPAPTAPSSSTPAVTNDSLKPNVESEMIRRKKKRSLTVPLAGGLMGDFQTFLTSIGLNIPGA